MVSSYEKNRDLGGTLEIQSNQPLTIRTIGAEGQGMFCQKIQGCWDQNNAGGCANNGAIYGKNPAWQVNIKGETEFMMRLAITAQVVGGVTIADAEEFKVCAGMSLFRTNASSFPLPPNQYSITSLRHATVSTSDGSYSWNLSAVVSKKEKIAPGVYILVPTTFEAGVYAHFEASLYASGNLM